MTMAHAAAHPPRPRKGNLMPADLTAFSILSPFSRGNLVLRNRLAVAPMSRVSTAGDGVPTERMVSYYRAFAQGGFGLVITEGTYTDDHHSKGYRDQPGLVTPDQTRAWNSVATAIHEHGAVAIAQLMHAGALSQHLHDTIAPSAVMPLGEKMSEYVGDGSYPMPAEMTRTDITEAVQGFVASALNAQRAGFDGVEIHAANGYLLDQFLTRYTNLRTDEYGGNTLGRARMTAEVVAAIRAVLGPTFLIGVRLSQTKVNDLAYRWQGAAEAEEIFIAITDSGADYLHIASEGRAWRETAELQPDLTITSLARKVTNLPVIANGGLHDPQQAEQLLGCGDADIISLARAALANPDLPHRVSMGQTLAPFRVEFIHPSACIANTDAWLAGQKDLGHVDHDVLETEEH
jgi:2,4-dienoyl-CoA reductase-like NADH-dependent reductase (Old Yellow Enzyme family)